MNHPILQNIKSLLIYIASWILVAAIHFAILWNDYHISLIPALTDSILFNTLFALLAIAIWYIVCYNQPDRASTFNLFISHLTTLGVIILIWLSVGFLISKYLFINDDYYHLKLSESLPWRILSGVLFYFIFVLIYYLILYYNNLQEKLENETKLNDIIRETELNLLKSQINPHFLFNSLNSVSSLTMTNPESAQEMIIKLSDFLRYTVTLHNKQFSSLRKELENIQRYLDIEKVRFGNRLHYNLSICEECEDFQIPVMLLQPLYENAVKHGVYESLTPVEINTTCTINFDQLEIVISNNFEKGAPSKKGAGLGLKNSKERLKLIYKSEQLLRITVTENRYEVKLIIPNI